MEKTLIDVSKEGKFEEGFFCNNLQGARKNVNKFGKEYLNSETR